MTRKGKLPRTTADERNLLVRQVEMEDEASEEDRSVPVTLATETAVLALDIERWEMVDEVLLSDGIKHGKQMPLVDSHNRFSVRDILGSIRELSNDNGKFRGRAYFSQRAAADEVFRDVKDGHITDMSITAERLEYKYVEPGETKSIRGRQFTAGKRPLRVVTKSRALEGSIVAVGADPNSKVESRGLSLVMRAYQDPYSLLEAHMYDELKALFVERGMPEDIEGPAVVEWLERHMAELSDSKDGKKSAKDLLDAVKEIQRQQTPPDNPPPVDPAEIIKRTLAIKDLCQREGIEEKQANEWITAGLNEDQVARKILERRKPGDKPVGTISPTESEADKFCAAAQAGILQRVLYGSLDMASLETRARTARDPYEMRRAQEVQAIFAKPAQGSDDFRFASLSDIARMYVERAGINIRNMPRQEIVRRAFVMQSLVQRSSDGPAFHTTGSFANLLLDAANKTLLMAYDEASVTYPIWVRTAPSAADYKTLNRIRFGELPDPEDVPENGEYPEATASDSKESYAVSKKGHIFSISLEAVVNDDLNAISRIPAMQGNAMRRRINRDCYAILTANAALSDGTALFHADHGGNTATNALAASALNSGFSVMMTQSGLNSTTILNLMPQYLIVPAALSATALQLINSMADPSNAAASTEDASRPNFNSGVVNLYGPQGPRRLTPVVEGQLDGNSTTAWYLAADSRQVDTVELTFLQGEESPVMEREESFTTDALKWKCRQSFATKAIDYRGLYRGNT